MLFAFIGLWIDLATPWVASLMLDNNCLILSPGRSECPIIDHLLRLKAKSDEADLLGKT